MSNQEYYTVSQAAEKLNKAPETIRRYIRSGSLHAKKIGKQWLVAGTTLVCFAGGNNELNGIQEEITLIRARRELEMEQAKKTIQDLEEWEARLRKYELRIKTEYNEAVNKLNKSVRDFNKQKNANLSSGLTEIEGVEYDGNYERQPK